MLVSVLLVFLIKGLWVFIISEVYGFHTSLDLSNVVYNQPCRITLIPCLSPFHISCILKEKCCYAVLRLHIPYVIPPASGPSSAAHDRLHVANHTRKESRTLRNAGELCFSGNEDSPRLTKPKAESYSDHGTSSKGENKI